MNVYDVLIKHVSRYPAGLNCIQRIVKLNAAAVIIILRLIGFPDPQWLQGAAI